DIVQQELPAGRVLSNTLPFSSDQQDSLGIQWTASSDQIVVQRARITSHGDETTHELLIYATPVDSNQTMHRVTTITPFPGQLEFGFALAPVGMVRHGNALGGLDS